MGGPGSLTGEFKTKRAEVPDCTERVSVGQSQGHLPLFGVVPESA